MNTHFETSCGYDKSACVCVCTWRRNSYFSSCVLICWSCCIPKAKLYSNQCVLQLPSHYHKSSMLPDHFLMILTLQFNEVWLSWSTGAKRRRNLWLYSQPSMELSVPNPIPPLCQLTQVFASRKLSMPEPLWGTEFARDFVEFSQGPCWPWTWCMTCFSGSSITKAGPVYLPSPEPEWTTSSRSVKLMLPRR